MQTFSELVRQIKHCQICKDELPYPPTPVFQLSPQAKILLIGQAPGKKVQLSGIPFNDPSGDRLRQWLNVSKQQFYDPQLFAILPMGLCYPGTGKSGDLAPRPICAKTWHKDVTSFLENIELTILIGKYAQDYYLPTKASLTEQVKHWRKSWPSVLPLPHPSPRNNIWLKKNPWFEQEILPQLATRVTQLIN